MAFIQVYKVGILRCSLRRHRGLIIVPHYLALIGCANRLQIHLISANLGVLAFRVCILSNYPALWRVVSAIGLVWSCNKNDIALNNMSEDTGKKQDTRFKKGKSGNPAGKPKGTIYIKTEIKKRLQANPESHETCKGR